MHHPVTPLHHPVISMRHPCGKLDRDSYSLLSPMNQSEHGYSVNDIASRRSVMRSVTAYTVRPIAVFCILISPPHSLTQPHTASHSLIQPHTASHSLKKGARKPHTILLTRNRLSSLYQCTVFFYLFLPVAI